MRRGQLRCRVDKHGRFRGNSSNNILIIHIIHVPVDVINGKRNPNCHPFGREISVFRYERAACNLAARMPFCSLPSTSAQMVRPGSYPLMFGWPVWIRVAEVVQIHLRNPDYIMASEIKPNYPKLGFVSV